MPACRMIGQMPLAPINAFGVQSMEWSFRSECRSSPHSIAAQRRYTALYMQTARQTSQPPWVCHRSLMASQSAHFTVGSKEMQRERSGHKGHTIASGPTSVAAAWTLHPWKLPSHRQQQRSCRRLFSSEIILLWQPPAPDRSVA